MLGVLITYYNERELLTECLASLLRGDEWPDEILVYDDASDAPAYEYVPSPLPIRIIRGERHCGAVHARNVLLHLTQCDYVHYQDADDLFDPAWCRVIKDTVRNTQADLILTEVSAVHSDYHLETCIQSLAQVKICGDLVSFALYGAILPAASTFRREVAARIGGHRELHGSQDWDFHIRLAAAAATFEIVDQPLTIKRIRPGSDSSDQVRVWSGMLDAIRLLSNELSTRYRPDLADAAARAGTALFALGAHSAAREAFELARRLGPPPFRGRRRLYRTLARMLGQETAERLGHLYRTMLPQTWRVKLARYLS